MEFLTQRSQGVGHGRGREWCKAVGAIEDNFYTADSWPTDVVMILCDAVWNAAWSKAVTSALGILDSETAKTSEKTGYGKAQRRFARALREKLRNEMKAGA